MDQTSGASRSGGYCGTARSGSVDQVTDANGSASPARRSAARLDELLRSRWLWILLLAAAIGPAFAVDIPAMLDYPNHLARMYLITDGPVLGNPFYEVHWNFNTNQAMDLVVPPLARIIGVALATKAFYVLSQLLLIGGALRLEYVVKGQIALSPYACGFLLYSTPFAFGFVNFELSLGIALCATAWWINSGQSLAIRAAIHSVFVLLLFVSHLFGLGVYGFVAGVHELWRFRSGKISLRELALASIVLAAPALAVLAIVAIIGGSIAGGDTLWDPRRAFAQIFVTTNGYSKTLSVIGSYIFIAFIYLSYRYRGRYLKFEPGFGWIFMAFLALFVAMPDHIFGTTFNSARVIISGALVIPAYLRVEMPSPQSRAALALGGVLIILANIIVVWWIWLSSEPEYRAMRTSMLRLERQSRVLVAHSSNDAEFPIWHAPTLAAATRGAYVSTLFTYPGSRTIRLRPQYADYQGQKNLQPLATFAAIARGDIVPTSGVMAFAREWPIRYDYLYVIGAQVDNPLPGMLLECFRGPQFTLYRILNHAQNKETEETRDAPSGCRSGPS